MALQVLFFATSKFAVPTLKKLISDREISLKGVVTQPDKPAGRKQEPSKSPVKIYAEKEKIKIYQPEKIRNNKEFLKTVESLNLDIIVVISYGVILPEEIFSMAKYGAINIHPSLLPKYRGASPINEALLRGDKETGVSIIKMNEKMDEGDIILIKKMAIEEKDDYQTLSEKLEKMAADLIVPILLDYKDGILKPIPQNHKNASYCKKMEKNDGKIDWKNETAMEIHSKIKAFMIWPGTYTSWNGKILKIKKSKMEKSEKNDKPGSIQFGDKKITVACKKNLLIPEIIQLEGKKETTIEEFLRGYESALRRNPFFGI